MLACIKSSTWGTRICCRLRRIGAYDQQKGIEWCRIGYFDAVEKSNDSHNSLFWSADAWRGHSLCQRVGHILDYESPRKHASSIIARKALRWKRIFLWMDKWSKTTSHLKRDSDTLQHGELRSYCGSRLVKFVFRIWFINFKDTFKTGESLLNIFFQLVFFTNSKWYWDSRTRRSNWKWHLGSTVFILTSPKTEIARSARGPKLQGPRAEDALAEPYFVLKMLVIWLQQITRSLVTIANFETITDMQSWCRSWPLNVSNHIRAKQFLRKHKGACKSSWNPRGIPKSSTLTIPWILQILWRSLLESLHVYTTKIRNK